MDFVTAKQYVMVFMASLSFIVFGTYWVPKLLISILPTQNLRKKYGAEWALVTGSSSGIGKSIAQRLALDGLNVVLVALNEPLLDKTFDELKQTFPDREFVKVGVNLGAPGYLDKVADATKDLNIQLVFNNAGYMLTGFFDKTPLTKLMMNHECNATSAMQITHLFVTRMLEANKKGCVVFTSSAAACQPTPFSALYGATKAYISSFAANIAVELRSRVRISHSPHSASLIAHTRLTFLLFQSGNRRPSLPPQPGRHELLRQRYCTPLGFPKLNRLFTAPGRVHVQP